MIVHAGAIVHETTARGDSIHVFGDIDETSVRELEEVLERVVPRRRDVTVNLTHSRYIGSLGLRALLHARQQARNGFETLVEPGSAAARLIEIAKLENVLGLRGVMRTGGLIEVPQPDEDVRIVSLEGEWDLSRGNELRRTLDRAVDHPHVILDMSNVTYIDSSCIGMLVRMRTQRVAKGYCPSRLVIASANVRRVLGLTGLHALWNMYETLDEALADLK